MAGVVHGWAMMMDAKDFVPTQDMMITYDEADWALQQHDVNEVVKCLASLGKLGVAGIEYSPQICSLLRADAPEVQIAAATALGNFGKQVSAYGSELMSIIEETHNESVKVATLLAVGHIGERGDKDLIRKVSTFLNSNSFQLVAAACKVLGQLGDETQAAVLAGRLQDSQTKYAALQGLYELGGSSFSNYASEIIDLCLSDKDVLTRQLAAKAVGASVLQGKQASELIDKLKKLIQSQEPGLRCAAAQALGHMGCEAQPYLECLEPLLADETEDTSWRSLQMGGGAQRTPAVFRKPMCAALSAFGMTGAGRYVANIAKKMNDDDWEVRLSALEALGCFGEASLDQAEGIAGLMEDDVYMVRAKVCDILGKIQATEQTEILKSALKDKSPSVRIAAVGALGALGEAGAAYSNEVFKLVSDATLGVRVAAIRSLGCMGEIGQCYASAIASQLNDAQAEVRLASVEVLGRLGDHGAAFAEEVEMCFEDPSPLVRSAAQIALQQMGEQSYMAVES